MNAWFAQLVRSGRVGANEIRLDIYWLIGLALLLIATGIGLRDPWPADEPRFALIARDMLLSGDWLIPQVGGDIYADKPPLFFWLTAICIWLTQSLRVGFLLPSLLSGIGCVVLTYDLARRLWNRETGFIAALTLLLSVQFMWQARQAQIDATLCFWTTLSLYGLLRHCLLGPTWRWYAIGWAAAGLGIITKGVGFLPLLVLVPFAFLSRAQWTPPAPPAGARWWLGPIALVAAVSIWLVPMLLAALSDPQIAAYRDEILFRQTVTRYAAAWHHREPFWYFIVEVIPVLWLPLTALTPWLWRYWRAAFLARDLRVALPLIWVIMVVLFFSLSTGKRGVYVLPALPGLVLASAPALLDLMSRRGVQRTLHVIACVLGVVTIAGAVYIYVNAGARDKLIEQYELDAAGPLLALGVATMLACLVTRPGRGLAAYALALASVVLVVSFWVNPAMNAARSGSAFVRKVETQAAALSPQRELGFVAYKEQYLLYITRPVVNFGHSRWREQGQEATDAAAWLAADPTRLLLVDEAVRKHCFSAATAYPIGTANRMKWVLVSGMADADCVRRGNLAAARTYQQGRGFNDRDL